MQLDEIDFPLDYQCRAFEGEYSSPNIPAHDVAGTGGSQREKYLGLMESDC